MPDATSSDPIYIAASVDVEEEGLFSGVYARRDPPFANAAHLARLIPLLERGLKPTLFCAYHAFANAAARSAIDRLRDRYPLEIGAHLHHWNTPPLANVPGDPPTLARVPATELDQDLFERKLDALLAVGEDFAGEPIASFRMGRWDLQPRLARALAGRGLLCDASFRPLHAGRSPDKGPDHFLAPTDPFRLNTPDGSIFEIPLTAAPLSPPLKKLPAPLRPGLKNWGALVLLPVQHPLWLMKLTTRLHLARGGRVLSLTWHSSEMMPGGSPTIKTEEDANRLIRKISAWLEWLRDVYGASSLTSAELRPKLWQTAPEAFCDGSVLNFPE